MALFDFTLTLTRADEKEEVVYEDGRTRRSRCFFGLFHMFVTKHPVWGDGMLYRDSFVTLYNVEKTICRNVIGYISGINEDIYETPHRNNNSWDHDKVFVKIYCSDLFYEKISKAADILYNNIGHEDNFIFETRCDVGRRLPLVGTHVVKAFNNFVEAYFPRYNQGRSVGNTEYMRHYPTHNYTYRDSYEIKRVRDLDIFNRGSVKRTALGMLKYYMNKIAKLPESNEKNAEYDFYSHLYYKYKSALYIKEDDENDD